MTDCLFCKIANRDIPSDIIFEDDQLVAFKDITPAAPVHTLIIPKRHISTINDLGVEDQSLMGHMILTAKQLAAENNLCESGFRLVMNCNKEGGQTVFHIHLHLLGGRQLRALG